MSRVNQDNGTWKCAICETINSEKYCFICGQMKPVLEDKKSCSCGYINNQDAKYCAKCGRKLLKSRMNWKLIIGVIFTAVVLLLTIKIMFTDSSDTNNKYTEETILGTVDSADLQKKGAEDTWKSNVLMREKIDTVAPLGYFRSSIVTEPVFGSDQLMRTDICRVIFEDTVRNVPKDCWDVSDARNNSVLAWVIPAENDLYELHIAAEGGINGKLACEDLFCGYQNVTSIEFNNCFHTEEAEDFSRMFYYCWQLKELDLEGIRTDNAVNLSEMFAHCLFLKDVDVSSFDTSKVEDTSGMFCKCMDLENVDITGFDLHHVRDVSYMFYLCPAGDGLEMILNGSWFRNVDRYKKFMDEDVLVNGKPWITLFEPEAKEEMESTPDLSAGDIITFGSYEQDNLEENGSEKIEWIVLDVQDNYALLLSRYALDSQRYHKVTAQVSWKNCSLREWLNNGFMNTAFTESQQKLIMKTELDNGATQDRIFILSCAEVDRYVNDWTSLICTPTSYAVSRGAGKNQPKDVSDAVSWWLRSLDEGGSQAYCVSFKGEQYKYMVGNEFMSVRPAISIDLSKAVLE